MNIYCGIGVCQACVVDGVRACLTPVPPGDATTSSARLVVIGAGPAGLSAALAAARTGQDVLILDRGGRPGGARRPERLIRRARRHPRITFRLGVDVWRAEPGRLLHLTDGDTLRPDAIILATGAHDRVLPFPGWELPGVLTVGGAQAQLKNQVPTRTGERVLVAGRGPLLQVTALALAASGHHVVGVADAVAPRRWLAHRSVIARSPARLLQGAWLRVRLRGRGIPVLTGHTLLGVTAYSGGLRATVAPPDGGPTWTVDVDRVAAGDGFTPQVELAVALGARTKVDPRDGSVVVDTDPDQRSSADGVFAAGEATGIGGAGQAAATGRVAGLAAAAHLGAQAAIPGRLRRRAARYARFADVLHQVTGVPAGWTRQASDDTVLCRCERVTFGQARHAIDTLGTADPRSLKLVTRVGMGPCQGRVCGPAAADLLGADPTSYAHRPVAVPVPLALFATEDHHDR